MFKTNFLCTLTLCFTIVGTQCDPVPDASSAVQGGFAFKMIMTKLQQLEDRFTENKEQKEKKLRDFSCKIHVYRSCREVPASGIYTIQPEKPFKQPITVFCDQKYKSGGWIVIQHRFEGSTNFYRNWQEYKNGFGKLNGEFWLGLDHIYHLTVSRPHELLVQLEDFEGNKTFAKYDQFEIGDENVKYEVMKLGKYSGTAGDSFRDAMGMKFSTFDADNDSWEYQCAVTFTGAWWYKKCHMSNLNGKYLRGETLNTGVIGWLTFRPKALKSSKMMIRPRTALVHK